LSSQPNLRICRRVDDAFDGEYLRRQSNGFGKIPGNTGKRREKKISEAVAVQVAFAVESEAKQAGHEMFVFGEGDHAVSDVAGRHHTEFLAQPAGTSAVVGHRYDDRQIGRAILQASKKSRESGSASNGKNSRDH